MADTFTLEVTISGLCVLLPKPTKMHVLLASACDHDGMMEPHYPRVFYDAAYDHPDPAMHADGTAHSAVPLDQRILNLAGSQAPGGSVSGLPDYLLDLSNFAPALPDPEAEHVPNLAARVTLPPGTGVCPNPQGAWQLRWGNYASTLPLVGWHVVWTTVGMQGTSLAWRLDGLNGFPGMPLAPLYPKDGYLRLLVSNVIHAESLPGPLHEGIPPAEGTPMPHFHAFSCLFPNPPSPWPDMVYVGPREPVHSTAYSCVPSGGH